MTFTYSGAIANGNGTTGALNIVDNGGLGLGGGTVIFSGQNTYSGATVVGNGTTAVTLQGGAANTFSANSATTVDANATLDLGGFTQTINTLNLAGGTLQNGNLASANGVSSTGGTINGIGGSTGLTTTAGTTTLLGLNTYTGATNVNGGTLGAGAADVLSPNSSYAVAGGAALDLNGFNQLIGGLSGTGPVINSGDSVPTLTIASGGTFAPGSGVPGSSMSIGANLAFQSGAIYLVQVNAADGARPMSRARRPSAAPASTRPTPRQLVAKTIHDPDRGSGVSGTFGRVVNTNLPASFTTSLSYDANHAFLNLALTSRRRPGRPAALNTNQQSRQRADQLLQHNGGIPLVYPRPDAGGADAGLGRDWRPVRSRPRSTR